MSDMSIGAVVDYCVEYNKIHDTEKQTETKPKPKRRAATQADWDAFWG